MSQAKIDWLFKTHALKIAPADKPFLYTSGLIGPYYINTHYLCGGDKRAEEVLSFIDKYQEPREKFPKLIEAELDKVFNSFPIYKDSIAALAQIIRSKIKLENIDFISGGQRRDWFFAPLVARELKLPCLYIYTDLAIEDREGRTITDLKNARVVNVADLLTVASSYTGKWIPAIKKLGGALTFSVNAVDRNQGGAEILHNSGLHGCYSLFSIDLALFDQAQESGYINAAQFELVRAYIKDPFQSMRSFLINNPSFLQSNLKSADEKMKQRAEKMVKEDLYKLAD